MKPGEQLEKVTAQWIVRLERGLTAAEQDEFIDWLTADPRHGDELNAQKTGWNRLNLLADWRPEHGAQPNCDLLAPPPARQRRWRVLAGFSAVALAAALAIGFFLGTGRTTPPAAAPLAPIALIEQRTLDDGSVVTLNRGAEIAVRFTAQERRVELVRGEAHFEVAKNPARPFIVAAEGVAVRAVGTAFKVRLDRSAVEVLVTEGRVGVTPGESRAAVAEAPLQLVAGERTVVSLVNPVAPRVTAVSPDDLASSTAWQPRLLEFNDTPLAAIVAEFNRANAPIRLELADVELEHRLLNTAIRSDNVEGFVRLLEGGFGIRADRTGNVIVLQRATASR
jgi:transmembrane sensor